MFLSPRRESNPQPSDLRCQQYVCIFCIFCISSTCVARTNRLTSWPSLCHLSPGSSMVRASHRRSEGCGFDPCLGLRNIQRILHGGAKIHIFYSRVMKTIFYEWAQRMSKILSSPREDEIHICKPPCKFLFIIQIQCKKW